MELDDTSGRCRTLIYTALRRSVRENGRIQTARHLLINQQAGYASQILYVSAISMAKLATLCFILTLTRTPLHRNITWAVVLLTLLWTIVSLFALSFQCPVPDSWAILANTCVNQVSIEDLYLSPAADESRWCSGKLSRVSTSQLSFSLQ